MEITRIVIIALLCIFLLIVNACAIAAPQPTTISQNKSILSTGVELFLGGFVKGAVAGTSNGSISDIKKAYSNAKNDIALAKKYFDNIVITNSTEKLVRDQFILMTDYYMVRMDLLSGEKEATWQFINGIAAMGKGDYPSAKVDFNSAKSSYTAMEQNRVAMESTAKKIDPQAWDIVIPKHENLTYIGKDLSQFIKDWTSLSQVGIHLSNAGIAKKQGNTNLMTSEIKNALTILNTLKDSPVVGKQASLWNASLDKKG